MSNAQNIFKEKKSTNTAIQSFIERIQGLDSGLTDIFCDLKKHIMFQTMRYCWIN